MNTSEQKWTSSVDGELGIGNQIQKELSAGLHIITLEDLISNDRKSVRIEVKKDNIKDYSIEYVTKMPYKKEFKSDDNAIGFFSLSCGTEGLCVTLDNNDNDLIINSNAEPFLCDNIQKPFLDTPEFRKVSSRTSRLAVVDSNTRHFYVLNTKNSYSFPTEYNARSYYSSDNNLEVWLPEELFNSNFDGTRILIDECIEKIENIILPRVKAIWGKCYDVNEDGKIAILFAPSINSEEKALGFFYSSDFFERILDKNDSAYNPYSNELDIIYVAIPENDGNYCINSIIATIAHELTHAINFSNNNFIHLETFLDEGLSHLTESLCGYGISGGNMKFVDYYLANSAYFSFCKNDYLGNYDSAGQRGAMVLFLYWLYEKYGEISFLQRIISAESNGWDAIGEAAGNNTDLLFMDFAQEILTKPLIDIFDFSKTDSITGEPIFCCNELMPYDAGKKYKLLPYSLFLISEIGSSKFSISASDFEPFFLLSF